MAVAAPVQAGAQSPIRRETGLDLLVVGSAPAQFLGGLSSWWRAAPRTRVGGGVVAGVAGGRLAGQGQVAIHFLLNPATQRGASVYGGGGLAVAGGRVGGEHLLVVLGLESRPGSGSGWVAEIGLGGGVRVAVGWRWRAMRRPPGRE